MADEKKVTAAAPKAAKKASKKVAKKATKKVAKKTAGKKTAAKKVAKKISKKVEANNVETRIEQLQEALRDNLSGLNTDKAEAVARNIWLAGLGAYSRTFDELNERGEELQDRLNEMSKGSQDLFEDLVARGEAMQGEAEKALKQGKDRLEDRVEDFRQRFGGGLSSFVDIPGRLRDAAERIEEISKRLDSKKK